MTSELRFKNFINLTRKEAQLVLNWRNSDRIRFKMINQDIISLENHIRQLKKPYRLYILLDVH